MLCMPAKARKVVGRSKSDPQQDALYAWENTWGPWNVKSLTIEECRWWVAEGCRRFDIAPPHVQRHYTKEYPWCNVTRRVISLSSQGMNAATVLHEVAHQITWDYFGESAQDHGRTFTGIYLHLLECGNVAPRVALHASARSHGLKWRQMSPEICKGL